ncbi:MAG TPA: type II secretion system F family protein [Candidatus Saccharimonadales bacterium]|nr:type II secretion system F family protein [Candidatus Saccharimonadales bacterium]
MLTYSYTALNPTTGQKIRADIEAENENAAAKLLIDRGMAPLDITAKAVKTSHSFRKHVPNKQKVLFSRQLSTLINAGLPLLQSLTTVQKQTKNKALNDTLSKIIADIEGGSSLASALEKHPDMFSNVYVNLVAAGEASGSLDTALERLATQQEKDSEVISKVRGAMIYPAIVLIVLFAILLFMTTTVLPQVSTLYKTIPGASLPGITTALIAFSNFITHFWWIALIILAAVIYTVRRYLKSEKGKQLTDHLKMVAWPFAPLFMKLYMARFARTGATLIGAGVPMIKMLNTTAEAVGNREIKASLDRAAEQVKGGKTLSASLQGDKHFLDLVPDMISIGEQSGALEAMLARVADYYEKEVDGQIKTINTIIEPLLMVMVGVVALIIVAAVLLPIYSLAGKNLGGSL